MYILWYGWRVRRPNKSYDGSYWCIGDYLVLGHLQPSWLRWLGSAFPIYSVSLWKDGPASKKENDVAGRIREHWIRYYRITYTIFGNNTVPDTHKSPLDACIRIASHARIRIACARIACECAHLRGTYACPVLYECQICPKLLYIVQLLST